jgi:acetylornithine deacetylase/succinyl-diaminopimelate desuccinylase-like protein
MSTIGRSELEAIRRRSARAALWTTMAVVAVATAGAGLWLRGATAPVRAFDWNRVDYAALPEVQLLQRYIALDTSDPDGDTLAGAELLAGELRRRAGIEAVIEPVGPHQANLWAVLPGDDPSALVLHHHIDVDPIIDLARWEHPPFGGEIDGPWIYGRGAFDMKSVAVAQLEAFIALANRGRRPSRTVILLATTGEETGSDLGTKWVLREHPELVSRFGVVLTEGGAVEGRSPEEVKYWGTETAQRRLLEVTVCDESRQRLESLRREILDSGRSGGRLRLAPEVAAFLERYAATRDRPDLRRWLADPARLLLDLRAFERQSPYLKSMFRDEALPNPVERAPGGGFRLRVYLLLLPGSDAAEAMAALLPPWRLHGLAVTVYDEGAALHGSPPDHPVMTEIGSVIHRRYPGVVAGPLFLPSTRTDARFLRTRGIPAYGFSPFMVLTPEVLLLARFGTANERIALPGFVEGVEIYRELVERLAGAGD